MQLSKALLVVVCLLGFSGLAAAGGLSEAAQVANLAGQQSVDKQSYTPRQPEVAQSACFQSHTQCSQDSQCCSHSCVYSHNAVYLCK